MFKRIKSKYRKIPPCSRQKFWLLLSIGVMAYILWCVKTSISCDKASLTNIFFAVFSISSVAIGLAYTANEIEELTIKKDDYKNKEIINGSALRDTIVMDIDQRIGQTKNIRDFQGMLHLVIVVSCFVGILLNETISQEPFQKFLRCAAYILAVLALYAVVLLHRHKQYLLFLARIGYDSLIKKIEGISKGRYDDLLP